MTITANKRLLFIFIAASILLLIPAIAMQFSEDVSWTSGDFFAAAVLLYGAGLLCEFVLRKVLRTQYRTMLVAGILVVLAAIWVELAVGIF